MLASEKKSLYRFMLIYLFSTLLMFGIGATVFYKFERFRIEEHARKTLKKEADRLLPIIRLGEMKIQRQTKDLSFAVFTGKKEYLFGTFRPRIAVWKSGFSREGELLQHLRIIPPPHRKHTAYLVVQKRIDQAPIDALKRMIAYAALLMLALLLVLGYFLGRLFIAPMREALQKITHFVQDTTHELNTPISTILTNIEMIEMLGKCPKSEEMERIRIASTTLSRIYDDLSYLKLNEEYQRQIESVNLSLVLEERLSYFASLMRAKQITLHADITPKITQQMDRTDTMRLFDNLLSNAIKYNQVGGHIGVKLTPERFSVEDSGRGMDKATQTKIFRRFVRGDKSEGGFGIGLDIVSQICTYYHYTIDVTSTLGKGSTIAVRFEKA